MKQITQLRLPVFQAPMFLLSGPEMVIASCRAGIVGSFPAPNARSIEVLDSWLEQIASALADEANAAPWAFNLVTHRSNPRREEDLAMAIKHKAPIVITALGSPKEAVEQVHSYGGRIYADVISPDHARKAADAGVDGLALVCSGAGAHTGYLSPFAFVEEVRRFFDGEIILAGAIGSGKAIHAAQVLGADYVYMGTRFIATHECMAADDYKQMVLDSNYRDIVTSDAVTGVTANWLRGSLQNVGFDPDNMPNADEVDFSKVDPNSKRWRDVWGAGQSVGRSERLQSIAELVAELETEYHASKSGQATAHDLHDRTLIKT